MDSYFVDYKYNDSEFEFIAPNSSMWDVPSHEHVPFACTPAPLPCTPSMVTALSPVRRIARPTSVFEWENDDEENSKESRSDAESSQPLRLDRPLVGQIARPLFFPVCEITDTEEVTLMQPPLEMDNEEIGMTHWCRPDADSQWQPLDEAECSQHTRMVRLEDPGAPTKKARGHAWRTSGNTHCREDNVSASMLCESSAPSHVTVIEEADESMDLPAHLSHLAVAPSATQKKLAFGPAVEEGEGPNDKMSGICGARIVGMQLILSRKRFLEERDANCGSAPPCAASMATPPVEGLHSVKDIERKYRRVDDVNVTL